MKIKYLCLISLALCGLAACSKSSADDNPNPRPGKEEEELPEISGLSSIYDLNTVEGYLNSHSATWQNSTLEMDFSSLVTIENPKLTPLYPMYPRIKKTAVGTYILIYQQNTAAHDVYFSRSANLRSWSEAESRLFAKTDMKQYESEVMDRVLFTSADAIVLANGDILAFASFRLNNGYRTNPLNNGIMMRRSTDNGNSWSDPEVIYRGTNWEPSALQLRTGEIHVYFTSSDPNKGDSGTALLRSNDNGKTWTSVGKIIRQYAGTAMDDSGDPIYTDQMPVAIQLNCSDRIAVALESRFGRTGTSADKYHISMAYCDDNWAAGGLTGTEEGPADRKSNLYLNEAAPYLRQFRSGETLLSTGVSKVFNIRIGNSKANQFGTPMPTVFKNGCWGSLEIIDDHTVIGVFPFAWSETVDGNSVSRARIQLAKFVLNHGVNAAAFTPVVDGTAEDWKNVDDALFIGSESTTSSVFRFGYDSGNLYGMIERKDESLTSQDGFELMFQSGNGSGNPVVLKFSFNEGKLTCSDANVKFAYGLLGNLDDDMEDDGMAIEFSIPRSSLNVVNDGLLFNAVIKDTAGDDTFWGLTGTNYSKWLKLDLKPASEPAPEPEPGKGENYGDGPSWGEGDEVDPW